MPFGKLLERRAGHDGKGRGGGLIALGGQIAKHCGFMGSSPSASWMVSDFLYQPPAYGVSQTRKLTEAWRPPVGEVHLLSVPVSMAAKLSRSSPPWPCCAPSYPMPLSAIVRHACPSSTRRNTLMRPALPTGKACLSALMTSSLAMRTRRRLRSGGNNSSPALNMNSDVSSPRPNSSTKPETTCIKRSLLETATAQSLASPISE